MGASKPGADLHRYQVKHDQILLDTKPGIPPETPIELPPRWESYLRLFPYRLHVPQIYGWVPDSQARSLSPIFLLEDAPIYPCGAKLAGHSNLEGSLMPELTSLWQQSTPLRQLNWLWQIAHLWQPLTLEKVASTLLEPSLLRVDGSCLRLLELKFDPQISPSLSDLGHLWLRWKEQISTSSVADFLDHLCAQMIQEQIKNSEQLIDLLDQGLANYSQTQTRQVQIATSTDQGPSRQSNEDACYPPSGSHSTISLDASQSTKPLVIVCDGIGGHEGGEVASDLAIATLQNQTEKLFSQSGHLDAATLTDGLVRATFVANDAISDRNDVEQRHERQRMGTTLVMALGYTHELYITHVGDSRAYRITRTGCYQITVDDDVASREVRLGYALYRDALQQSASGSLVQALGMGSSSFLHPTVQRFILEEDCVFLLCSDGLSDHDRVDEIWETEIAPILNGNVDLAAASQRLVEIANTRNGHDNVTIGLVYCQVSTNQQEPVAQHWQPPSEAIVSSIATQDEVAEPAKTQLIQPRRSPFRWLAPLVTLTFLFGLGGLLLYLLVPELRARINSTTPIATVEPSPSPSASSLPTPDSPLPTESTVSNPLLEVGALVKLDQVRQNLKLLSLSGVPVGSSADSVVGEVPSGSVLQVVGKQTTADRRSWLRLKVCSVPTGAKAASKLIQAGASGWLEESTIAPFIAQNFSVNPDQLSQCTNPTP